MYLITPTLLNNFQFYKSYEGEREAEIREDFLKKLAKIPIEPTEAMLNGIKFEDDIHKYCEGGEAEGVVQEIGDVCMGGLWQQVVKKELDEFLLYGRTDVIKEDTIYDIKFTKSYDLGKFEHSSQHRIYLYCSGLPAFSYLVSNGRDWWKEDYVNHDGVEQEIRTMINEFTGHLEHDPEASEYFYSKWRAK